MRILVSGASGFVGRALVPFLRGKGYEVVRLIRTPSSRSRDTLFWLPSHSKKELEGFDAVIHLAGESIAGRWTEEKMHKILESRSLGTQQLAEALSKTKKPPRVFLSPSAVGYFGDRGEEVLFDESLSGVGFFPEVCRNWEGASAVLSEKGCRVVHPRFGLVLGRGGGILKKIIFPTKLFLAGSLGSGRQWISWVSLRDVVSAIDFALNQPLLAGSFNLVAPEPIRQEEFAQKIAERLHRKVFLSYPSRLLRIAFGRMADEVLLASAKVKSKKLLDLGFEFHDLTIDSALKDAIK